MDQYFLCNFLRSLHWSVDRYLSESFFCDVLHLDRFIIEATVPLSQGDGKFRKWIGLIPSCADTKFDQCDLNL